MNKQREIEPARKRPPELVQHQHRQQRQRQQCQAKQRIKHMFFEQKKKKKTRVALSGGKKVIVLRTHSLYTVQASHKNESNMYVDLAYLCGLSLPMANPMQPNRLPPRYIMKTITTVILALIVHVCLKACQLAYIPGIFGFGVCILGSLASANFVLSSTRVRIQAQISYWPICCHLPAPPPPPPSRWPLTT